MHARRVARRPGIHALAPLVQRVLVTDVGIVVVQVVDIGRDSQPLGVGPRAVTDSVPGVDGGLAADRLRAQIRLP